MPDIHSIMFSNGRQRTAWSCASRLKKRMRGSTAVLLLCLGLAASGCVESTVPKHVDALANATAPVVDQAAEAYHTARAIHSQSVNYDAAAEFDKTGVFVPSSIQDWPPEKEIAIRLAVLAALKQYVADLEAISGGTDSSALDTASTSLGTNLTTLANSLAPAAESALGVTPAPSSTTTTTTSTTTTTASGSTTTTSTETGSTAPPLISAGVEKGFATALDALGRFLVSRTVNKELPQQVEAMDKTVETLCETLAKEMELIQEQEKIDSNNVIDRQTDFVRNAKLDAEQRRIEFMKLPAMAREQRANDQSFAELRAALLNLELTHHALAAAAQGNNPETFTQKLGDLGTVGASLGKFYLSLPSDQ